MNGHVCEIESVTCHVCAFSLSSLLCSCSVFTKNEIYINLQGINVMPSGQKPALVIVYIYIFMYEFIM